MAADRNRTPTRVPPHNAEAEESLLGAALLDAGAAAIAATVDPSDFYHPAHRPIAYAIGRLVAAGHTIDPVTVGEELRRTGENALVPDGLLGRMMNGTPSIGGADRYASIVRDAAALRRLLHVASDITEIAYTRTDPADALLAVADVVDRLGTVIDPTAISSLEVADIAGLLADDLKPEEPSILTRSDGGALLYPGKMHMFQAEPTAGKTFLGMAAVAEVLAFGGSAVWYDLEDTARGLLGRAVALGIPPDALAQRFRYVQPVGPFGQAERIRLDTIIDEVNPDLIIIDGVGEALARDGLSEDKAADVLAWVERLPRPLARTGAAVLMIDHVVKNREEQGRWARGSSAKLGVIDGASYQLKVVVPFSRNRAGKVKVVIAKDRPGGVGALNEVAAMVTITPHANGERVVIDVDPYVAEMNRGDPWKPTGLMARVSALIGESDVPLTATAIKSMLPHSKPSLVQQAITRLVDEGYISAGRGRTKAFSQVKPYTDPDPVYQTPPPHDDADAPPDYTDQALFADH